MFVKATFMKITTSYVSVDKIIHMTPATPGYVYLYTKDSLFTASKEDLNNPVTFKDAVKVLSDE
jgi:hypothetical protein